MRTDAAPGLATARRSRPQARTWALGGDAWIAIVCVAYTASQALFVAPAAGLGFDESVYVSQVDPRVPASFFSAPRARGVSFLVAPIVGVTGHTVVMRLYLAVLSGAGLFVALWLWRPLCRSGVLALAGALFASLWISQFYGTEAMPNMWVALASLAAVGCFLRVVTDRGDRRILAILAVSVAIVALMRPSDAAWVILPLVVSGLVVRRWRRPLVLVVLLGGVVVGSAEWVIESFVRYGGVAARLHQSSLIEGGFGFNLAAVDQLKSQSGRLLCRPCTMGWHRPVASVWLIALPVLVALSVLVAARAHRLPTILIPVLCAISISVPYLVLINYAAPRFLLPAYALLAIPLADLLVRTIEGARPRWRPAVLTLVVIALAAHLTVQYAVLAHTVRSQVSTTGDYSRIATQLAGTGVRRPCVVVGFQAIPVGVVTGCSSASTGGNNANTTDAKLIAQAAREDVAIIVAPGARVPWFASNWTNLRMRGMKRYHHYRVYLSPKPPR